jgi:3-oxoacyl-[acyl-carrier protein] reductase
VKRSIAGAWPAKNPCELTPSRLVETEGLRASGLHEGEFRELQEKRHLSGRIATPEDIALAATFLASDDARWITGQVIVAAGGKRM